ncbi:MAG: DUF4160 domain-containing protein [Bacteroidales bacterium]
MPTILVIAGWRLFFYSNEGLEPIHVHAEKGDIEIKFWIDREKFEIAEAFSYNTNPQANREIRKIIFEHFDYIVSEWDKYFSK